MCPVSAARQSDARDSSDSKVNLRETHRALICDFRDPWGNRIQVVDLHDESLVWLLPYREVQKAGVRLVDGESRPSGS